MRFSKHNISIHKTQLLVFFWINRQLDDAHDSVCPHYGLFRNIRVFVIHGPNIQQQRENIARQNIELAHRNGNCKVINNNELKVTK